MSKRPAKPPLLDLDAADLARMLERIRSQISPEDHVCVEGVVQTLIELTRLVRNGRTTIARLRWCWRAGYSTGSAHALPRSGISRSGVREAPRQRSTVPHWTGRVLVGARTAEANEEESS